LPRLGRPWDAHETPPSSCWSTDDGDAAETLGPSHDVMPCAFSPRRDWMSAEPSSVFNLAGLSPARCLSGCSWAIQAIQVQANASRDGSGVGFKLVAKEMRSNCYAHSRDCRLLNWNAEDQVPPECRTLRCLYLQSARSDGWRCLPGRKGRGDVAIPVLEIAPFPTPARMTC